jgi:DNA-binding MarR family transcriptional regulator
MLPAHHFGFDIKIILMFEPYILWLESVKLDHVELGWTPGRAMAEEVVAPQHSVMCLRLMQVFRRVSRGMRRWQDGAAPPATAPLSPRHVAALEQLLGGPVTVSELAARLGLTLTTVSGVLAGLDRAGFIERHPDPADRRRTIVAVIPAQAALVQEWLDGAARPLARVLDKLSPSEQEAFLKAMDLLETELHAQDTPP